MPQSNTLQLLLAFAVLALAILAFGDRASPAWWWLALTGAALAAVVFVGGWSERRRVLAEPVSAKMTAFIAAELVLPVLVVAAVAGAWTTGAAAWLDAAVVLAVALAVVSLL